MKPLIWLRCHFLMIHDTSSQVRFVHGDVCKDCKREFWGWGS